MKSISKVLGAAFLLFFIAVFTFNIVGSIQMATAYEEVHMSASEDNVVFAQLEEIPDQRVEELKPFDFWSFVRQNAVELFLAFLGLGEGITRLTPTTKDDAWFVWLRRIIDAIIPNLNKELKRHPTPQK